MTKRGFVTNGSSEYFAEREQKISTQISEARAKIDEINARVAPEIAAITEKRERLRAQLDVLMAARNDLVKHCETATALIGELEKVTAICDIEVPNVDRVLDLLQDDYEKEDTELDQAEKARRRQLSKHERKQQRYELRSARLSLRKKLLFDGENGTEQ